jgi:hypothetical protein
MQSLLCRAWHNLGALSFVLAQMTTTPLHAAIEQHRHRLWSICYA